MRFRTTFTEETKPHFIQYSSSIMIIGSCFAEHVYRYLHALKYNCFLNPCGISYNPISISKSIEYLLGMVQVSENEISEEIGRYFHFDFHGKFAGISKLECKEKIDKNLENAKKIGVPDVLIISLGTSFAYKLLTKGQIVNNCHKVPQSQFEKVFTDVNLSASQLSRAINLLKQNNPNLKTILTVSPVRHVRDGMVENTRSKANLHMLCQKLESELENIYYFPSYEIMMDDLRGYRFYDTDMIHPNQTAIKYILEKFEEVYLSENEFELRSKVANINKRLNHKPFLPESVKHKIFLEKLIKDIQKLVSEKSLNFDSELDLIKNQLT